MKFLTRLWSKIIREWWQLYVPYRLKIMGVSVGKGARFYGMPIVQLTPGSTITIGDRVVLCSDSRFTALGVNHPVVLRTLRPNANITIGDDTGISGGAICAAISIQIGKECLLGANVTIVDTDFHAIKPDGRRYNNNTIEIAAAAVTVEDNVFIGTGAIVLKGVIIGHNSVIGAMSAVSQSVPRNEIWAGKQAGPIKKLAP